MGVKHFVENIGDNVVEISDDLGEGGEHRPIVRISPSEGVSVEVSALADGITVNDFPVPMGTSIDADPGDVIGLTGGAFMTVQPTERP